MSTFSILTSILALFLLLFSIGQVVLGGLVLNYNTRKSSFAASNTNNINYNVYWLPLVNYTRSYALQTATGALGVVIGAFALVFSLWQRPLTFVGTGKRAPRSIGWAAVTSILAIFLFCLALPALVVSFYDSVHYGTSSVSSLGICTLAHNGPGVTGCSSTITLYRPYTIEAWTCYITRWYSSNFTYFANNGKPIMSRTCKITYISRWWTVSLLVLPILLAATALLEIRSRNMARYEAQRTAAAGLYPKETSFSSAEPGADSPVSPIGTLPSYRADTELHGKARASAEMGGRQLMEAPEKSGYDELPAEKHQVLGELPATRSKVDVAGS